MNIGAITRTTGRRDYMTIKFRCGCSVNWNFETGSVRSARIQGICAVHAEAWADAKIEVIRQRQQPCPVCSDSACETKSMECGK